VRPLLHEKKGKSARSNFGAQNGRQEMKIQFKTVQGDNFAFEFEPSDTVRRSLPMAGMKNVPRIASLHLMGRGAQP
jgi:hypothetical protein